MLLRKDRLAAALASVLLATPASATEPSGWSMAHGAAIRLLPAGPAADGTLRAGLEIRLEDGWKTYWRNPGDSGVPPTFDWSRSRNLADVTVLWPAPERFTEGESNSIGYTGDVVLPLKVRAIDAAKPVSLALALQYGACKTICVPATGEAILELDPGSAGSSGAEALVSSAEKAVPTIRALGADGPLSVVAIRSDLKSKRLRIDVRADADAQLLVEGDPDWYLPQPTVGAADAGGLRRFELALEGIPKDARLVGTTLRFTLVGAAGAVETAYTLQ